MRPIIPPIRNTGSRPSLSAMGGVVILMKLPEDWLIRRRLFATPLFSGVEFFATSEELRTLTAPKLTPERKNIRTIDR